MKKYFSENLKKLRRTADITQEKLAEFVGVTPQTVSKWERAETYPDIETLPVIANYFGVTIDELLGNDKTKTDEMIDKLIADSSESARLGDEAKAFTMAVEGYKRYPYSYKMMDFYTTALQSYDVTNENWKERKPEIRRVAELILDGCTVEDYRYGAIESLCCVCEPEEREEMRKKIPSGFNFTQELWMEDIYPADTDKGIELRQKNMQELLWWFNRKVLDLCGRWFEDLKGMPQCDDDTWLAVNEMQIAIYNCPFRDGDYLDYAWHMAVSYSRMAETYMMKGDGKKSAECWLKTAEFSAMHESIPPYAEHTSYLVSRLVYDESKMGIQGSCGSPEDYLHQMKQPIYDPLRDNQQFTEAVRILETCPRNTRIRDEKDFQWINNL